MARQNELTMQAISIENALLAHDYLAKIATLQAAHQSEADYTLPKGMKLRDEIGRYWRIAGANYEVYAKLSDNALIKTVTDKWLVPLLQEVLGFTCKELHAPLIVGERAFAITHMALEKSVPMVLTAPGFDLDRADARYGDESRKRRSPHALLQEYLNASDEALWGIVSNGDTLRIVRDNPSLTRPAFVQIDLRRIFSEELYSEFVLFWLLSHRSRFEQGDDCILEQWRESSEDEGERALDELRAGVMEALLQLGNGFLVHAKNQALKEAMQEGKLSLEAYQQELLRLIYRLLFLFTAEERDLLFDPAADDDAKTLYLEGYSLRRLRNLSLRHSLKERHDDLFEGLKITFGALGRGERLLALPALGGLFNTSQCPWLDALHVENHYLLSAIRHLSFFKKGGVLSRINYRDMDSEELGSVYESLLELIPEINPESSSPFGFMGHTAGSARKLSGSYYTNDDLVQELIKSALVPVIEEKIKSADDPIKALLGIKVIDPASGSGHFLLAAARKIAEHVAYYMAEGQPTQKEYRHALREVIGHCIYGVDLNPLAVELCKTALWLESIEPGKPLGFLDSRIQYGNALVGLFDGTLLKEGIPADAYKPLSGDDKVTCNTLKAENKQHAKEVAVDLQYDFSAASSVCAMPEETFEQIAQKAQAWSEMQQGMNAMRLREDLFTAAFFATKTADMAHLVPTNRHLRLLIQNQPIAPQMREHITALAQEQSFFHWHLAFPDVFDQGGGFDCVLGNPPWEKIKLQEIEFFASRAPEIANAQNASARGRMIAALEREHPSLFDAFMRAKRAAEATSQFVRAGRFALTATGDINLYALFAEHMLRLISKTGRAGVVVPTGIATDDGTKAYFSHIAEGGRLVSLYDFENREGIFAGVHRSYKFSLLTLGQSPKAELLFFATQIAHLKERERRFSLSPEEFALLNPNTRTCPIFRTQQDAELTKKLYRAAPILIREATEEQEEINLWGIRFQRMIDMANDSKLFTMYADLTAQGAVLEGNHFVRENRRYLPLYEAKMIHHYDHRWATYEQNGDDTRDMTPQEKQNPQNLPLPRYWVDEREVYLRTADLPNEIKKALKDDDAEALREAVLFWLLGCFTCNRDPRAKKALALLGGEGGLFDPREEKALKMAESYLLDKLTCNALWEVLEREGDLFAPCWALMKERAPKFLMGWRDITNSTNERTVIASVVPLAGSGDTLLLMYPKVDDQSKLACLLADQISIVHDYTARQKVGGTHLKYHVKKQLPILPPDRYTQADLDYIVPRVLELSYTAEDLRPWAEALGFTGEPFGWDEERRLALKCQLDAYYAHLYGLERDELRYILDPSEVMGEEFPSVTFPGLKRKEMQAYGEYRTARLVLEAYDRLAGARKENA